jgi:hypothetical protein
MRTPRSDEESYVVAGRRTKLAAVAAGATAVLAGCGLHPGAAAVVGSETISHEQVDDVAAAVCTANVASSRVSSQPPPTLANSGAREVALQILLETELSQQFGAAEGVEATPQDVSAAVAQNENGLMLLPEDQRQDFRAALRDYAESQLLLIEIGKQALGEDAGDNEALQAGLQQRAEYVEQLDVEVDPRYGRFADGGFKRGGAALSVPVTEQAKSGASEQPSTTFVTSLPRSQQCR